jgi:hypothetical protein
MASRQVTLSMSGNHIVCPTAGRSGHSPRAVLALTMVDAALAMGALGVRELCRAASIGPAETAPMAFNSRVMRGQTVPELEAVAPAVSR